MEKALLAISFGCMALCYIWVELGLEIGLDKTRVKVALITGLALLVLFFIYMLYLKLIVMRQADKNSQMYIQQMELYRQQKQLEDEVLKEIRVSKHNFKHQLSYLKDLAYGANRVEFETAAAHIETEIFSKIHLVASTGNLPVDSIINNREQEARKRNVQFHTNLKIPHRLMMGDVDLCVLLGNALDNAIEAVSEIKAEEKHVYIEIEHAKGLLYMQIKNQYQGELNWIEPGKRLKSKKKEGIHGLGLDSIRKIVSKYHGKMLITNSDDIFILELRIYIQEDKRLKLE